MLVHDDVEDLNHIIVWLDQNFSNPNDYRLLKKAFASSTDPRCESLALLTDCDYERLLNTGDGALTTQGFVHGLLHTFTQEHDCLRFLERNQDKRIFFIISGDMARTTVPKIIERYRQIFTDIITNTAYPSIYILCHDIRLEMDWSEEYLDYLQMFDFDAQLLERLVRDIAEYYIERGERLRQDNSTSNALQCFHWARKLWYNYDKMYQNITNDSTRSVHLSQRMSEINRLIDQLESISFYEVKQDSDDDEDAAEPCS